MLFNHNKRKALAKVFINITGIIFGLLLIGPLVSAKGFDWPIFIVGSILFLIFLLLVIIVEPSSKNQKEEE